MRYVSMNGIVIAEIPNLTIQRPTTLVQRTGLPAVHAISLDRITSVRLLARQPAGWGSLSIAIDDRQLPPVTTASLSADPGTVIFAEHELPTFQALGQWLDHVVQVNQRMAASPSAPGDHEPRPTTAIPYDVGIRFAPATVEDARRAGEMLWSPEEEGDEDLVLLAVLTGNLYWVLRGTALLPVDLADVLERRGTTNVYRMLAEKPIRYDQWEGETDLGRAYRAAERAANREAEEKRLALSPSQDPQALQDKVDRVVFLTGRYRRDLSETRPAHGDDPGRECGRLTLANGDIHTLFNVPASYDGRDIWLIATAVQYVFNEGGRFISEVAGQIMAGQVLPRWTGMNAAFSAARLVVTSHLLDDARDHLPEPAAPFVRTLAALHAPRTLREAKEAQPRDIDDALSWLADQALVGAAGAPTLPEPRMVKGHAAAEIYAAEVLSMLGFTGVQRTPAGADGGVDVVGDDVVAQVKMEALPTGRDRIQALAGIARVEDAHAIFFSLSGYTAPAIDWADRAAVALLEFETDGSIGAVNALGRRLLADGAAGMN